jgi:hypothetical protein
MPKPLSSLPRSTFEKTNLAKLLNMRFLLIFTITKTSEFTPIFEDLDSLDDAQGRDRWVIPKHIRTEKIPARI